MKKTIEIPEGFEIDLENSSKDKIVLKDMEYDWEDIEQVKDYYITAHSNIVEIIDYEETNANNKNNFPTKEEAEAALALSQLLQWRNRVIGNWKPDFKTEDIKYVITVYKDEIMVRVTDFTQFILTFESRDQAYKFMNDHMKLIKQAKPLL